jgi:hypothetical protein
MAEPCGSAETGAVTGYRRTPSRTPASVPVAPSAAHAKPDGESKNKSGESSSSLARIETTLVDVHHTLSIQFQRIATIQAELDKLATAVKDHIAAHADRR